MDITSYILLKKYVEDSLTGVETLNGKSAYQIAQENGFIGSEQEWLASLKGSTPSIGPEGTWVIDGVDTGVVASPSLDEYATKDYVDELIETIIIPGGSIDNIQEPAEEDIPKIFFSGELAQSKTAKVVPFRYISKTQDFYGFAEIKAQGNSSMSYAKKNQTVKMFKDESCEKKLKIDFKNWGKQNKHVYKANWIDLTHARNIVSARLWGDIVRSRSNFDEYPEEFKTSPNVGAIDGFPVKVYANGIYQGRYTLNIPKDKWMSNMNDDLDNHCILCGENYASGCFRAKANINGSDWSDEIHDSVPASIKTRWNEVISFVMNSTDEEFKANLGNYFDINSVLDYFLFGLASCGLDAFGKNQIYMTYDGQKWIASMYDMDSTWGLYWNGGKFVATDYARTSYEDMINGREGNLLYLRLEQLFYSELQNRWAELKVNALSIENIINRFERFTDIAPTELVNEDYASTTGGGKFTGIPSKTTNHIQQIRSYALARLAWTDTYVAGLTPPSLVPCTGITLSTDNMTFNEVSTQTLTATVTPDGCTDEMVWISSNPSAVMISVDGNVCTVQSVANGSSIITVTCGEYSASCTVEVSDIAEPVPCAGITLDKTELTFNGEGTETLVVTVTPEDTTDSIIWTSSNMRVATVSNDGVVTAVANGNATITATCGSQSVSCNVIVSGIEEFGLLYSLLEPTVFDGVDDYIDTGIKLFDEPKDFTIVLSGIFNLEGNAEMSTVFHCKKESSGYPGIALDIRSTEVNNNEYKINNLLAYRIPTNVISIVITCKDGNIKNIGYFSDGNVIFSSSVITYTTIQETLLLGAYQDINGKKGRFWKGKLCNFKVYNYEMTEENIINYLETSLDLVKKCTNIALDKTELVFNNEYSSQTITAITTPEDTDDIVTWRIDDSSIATVENGVVTPIKNGSANIIATCGNYSATCVVSIYGMEEPTKTYLIDLNIENMKLAVNTNGSLSEEGGYSASEEYLDIAEYDYISVISDTDSCGIAFYDSKYTFIINKDTKDYNSGKTVFTIPTNAKYCRICQEASSGTIVKVVLYKEAAFERVSSNSIEWSSERKYSINANNGIVGTGSNYVTLDTMSIPNRAVAVRIKNINSANFTYLLIAGYDNDMNLISYLGNHNNTNDILMNSLKNIAYLRFSAFYNDRLGNIPSTGLGIEFLYDIEKEPETPEINVGETLLYENYSPNGEAFSVDDIEINFANGDYVEAEIDLTNCINAKEAIFSIGKNINIFHRANAIHMYFTSNIKELEIDFCPASGSFSRKFITLSDDIINIKINKYGIAVNNTIINKSEYSSSDLYINYFNELLALNTINIGSVEGNNRSNATYNYIKVVRMGTEPEPEAPGADIDYNTDALVGVMWNSDCDYNSSGELIVKEKHYCSEKFSLQNCLYLFPKSDLNTYKIVFIWDANNEYVGAYGNISGDLYIYGNPDFKYSLRVYSDSFDSKNSSAIPVDNRSTMIDKVEIDLASQEWVNKGNNYIECMLNISNDFMSLLQSCNAITCTEPASFSVHSNIYSKGSSNALLFRFYNNNILILQNFTDVDEAISYFTENETKMIING